MGTGAMDAGRHAWPAAAAPTDTAHLEEPPEAVVSPRRGGGANTGACGNLTDHGPEHDRSRRRRAEDAAPHRRHTGGVTDTRRASVHAGFGLDGERWTGYPTAPGDGTGTTARNRTEDNAHAR